MLWPVTRARPTCYVNGDNARSHVVTAAKMLRHMEYRFDLGCIEKMLFQRRIETLGSTFGPHLSRLGVARSKSEPRALFARDIAHLPRISGRSILEEEHAAQK